MADLVWILGKNAGSCRVTVTYGNGTTFSTDTVFSLVRDDLCGDYFKGAGHVTAPAPCADAGSDDAGQHSCLTASDCAAGEHCDVVLDKCDTGGEAVLNSSKCTKPACGSACLGEACTSSEDCAGGQVCGMGSPGGPSCSSPCCQDWGRCSMVPSCREGCTAVWPPHETCFVCVCPSCETPAETSAKHLFEQAYALSSTEIACTGDEDCCVVLDNCNNAALIVHQNDRATVRGNLDQAIKLADGPTPDAPCNACIPPPVVARCVSGKCVGRVLHCSLACLGDAGLRACLTPTPPAGAASTPLSTPCLSSTGITAATRFPVGRAD